MSDKDEIKTWLARAKSNLSIAQRSDIEGIFFEDLCFEAEQAAEKALKALLIYVSGEYLKVHSFSLLLSQLGVYLSIPEDIKESVELSDYAVQTRYPGDYYPVGEEEYHRAIDLAERVVKWVEEQIPGVIR
jgi:HEPN domain-containing protein